MNFLFNNTNTNPYLSVYTVGYEETQPSHSYGPAVRSGYMLHYIYKGRGTFTCQGKIYSLKAGDFFFISPQATIQYQAHETDPWAYYWFGFRGDLAQHYLKDTAISSDNPVFSDNDPIKSLMNKLIEISLISESNDIMLNTCLLEILNQLNLDFPSQNKQVTQATHNLIVAKAISFMTNNYETNIRITDIANHLAIDRTYLHRLFVQEIGQAPKTFLTNIRLRKAKELLRSTKLPIKNIAYSIGFEDSGNFSKLFKHEFGMSPGDFRKKLT